MKNSFYALISRMRYIGRWGLMRNTFNENIQEHSHMVAVLAHALALIGNQVYGRDINPEACATAALFHDASEIFTGDMPTPVKYDNQDIRAAYKKVEAISCERLLDMLPEQFRDSYKPLLLESDASVYPYVKAADKLSAYIKCVEELKAGNSEFESASKQTMELMVNMKMPELDYFIEHFLPPFAMNLDELER